MASEVSQGSDAKRGTPTPNFKKAIRVQGHDIDNFQCTTDVPVIIEGSVKAAKVKASWLEVLPNAKLSGDVEADHLVVRGEVDHLQANVRDFFALDSAVMQSCRVIFDSVRGCSIHPQAQILGSVQFALRQGHREASTVKRAPEKTEGQTHVVTPPTPPQAQVRIQQPEIRPQSPRPTAAPTPKVPTPTQPSASPVQQVQRAGNMPQSPRPTMPPELKTPAPTQSSTPVQQAQHEGPAPQSPRPTAAPAPKVSVPTQSSVPPQQTQGEKPAPRATQQDQSTQAPSSTEAKQAFVSDRGVPPILQDVGDEENPNIEETDDGYASLSPPSPERARY